MVDWIIRLGDWMERFSLVGLLISAAASAYQNRRALKEILQKITSRAALFQEIDSRIPLWGLVKWGLFLLPVVVFCAYAFMFQTPLRFVIPVSNHDSSNRQIYRVFATVLIYFMQFGFIAFEAGMVHRSYRLESAVKNLLVFIVSYVSYVGVALFAGPWLRHFLGNYIHLPTNMDLELAFHAGFASTVSLIVANAITERTTLTTNLILAFVAAGIGYPVVSNLLWEEGILFQLGFIDTAGACVVHLLGGVIGYYAILYVGPRFRTQVWDFLNKPKEPDQRSLMPLTIIGGVFLWFGWLGFNSGNATVNGFPRALFNTCLGACGGGLASLVIYVFAYNFANKQGEDPRHRVGNFVMAMADLERIVVGMMGGLVVVTANASNISNAGAFVEATTGGFIAFVGSSLIEGFWRNRFDDPLGVLPTHVIAAVVGILWTPIWEFWTVGRSMIWHRELVQVQGCAICWLVAFTLVLLVRGLVRLPVRLTRAMIADGDEAVWCFRFVRLRLSAHYQATGKHGIELRAAAPRALHSEGHIINQIRFPEWDTHVENKIVDYLIAEGRAASEEVLEAFLDIISLETLSETKFNERERISLVAMVLLAPVYGPKTPAILERCLKLDYFSLEYLKTIIEETDRARLERYRETLIWTIAYLAEDVAHPGKVNLAARKSQFVQAYEALRTTLRRGRLEGREVRNLARIGIKDLEVSFFGRLINPPSAKPNLVLSLQT